MAEALGITTNVNGDLIVWIDLGKESAGWVHQLVSLYWFRNHRERLLQRSGSVEYSY